MNKYYHLLLGLAVVLILAVSIVAYFYANKTSARLFPTQGLTLVYAIEGTTTENGTSTNNQTVFVADLMPNYTMVLNQLRNGAGFSYHPETDCIIHSERIFLTINIISKHDNIWYSNITMTFYHGNGICGAKFGTLPQTDGSWVASNGTHIVSSFLTLNITRQVTINSVNSDTQSDTCSECGIWPFWVNLTTFAYTKIIIPYNLNEGVLVTGLNGTASVIAFDNSIYPNISFSVSGKTFRPDQQIAGSIISPWEIIYSNLSESDIKSIVSIYHQLNYSAMAKRGTVIVNYNPAFSSFDGAGLAWTLRNISSTEQIFIGSKFFNATNYYYIVQYGGREYMIGSPPGICLYTKSGILLACNFPDSGWNLFSVLPTPIDRLFGVNFESQYYANQLYIKLVDISG